LAGGGGWIGFKWLRIGTGGRLLCGGERLGSFAME
jgi:hypothetical protein